MLTMAMVMPAAFGVVGLPARRPIRRARFAQNTLGDSYRDQQRTPDHCFLLRRGLDNHNWVLIVCCSLQWISGRSRISRARSTRPSPESSRSRLHSFSPGAFSFRFFSFFDMMPRSQYRTPSRNQSRCCRNGKEKSCKPPRSRYRSRPSCSGRISNNSDRGIVGHPLLLSRHRPTSWTCESCYQGWHRPGCCAS